MVVVVVVVVVASSVFCGNCDRNRRNKSNLSSVGAVTLSLPTVDISGAFGKSDDSLVRRFAILSSKDTVDGNASSTATLIVASFCGSVDALVVDKSSGR